MNWLSMLSSSDRLLKFTFYIAEGALGLMVLLIGIDVFVRNVLHIGLTYTTEYCGYLLVMLVFLGAPYSLRQGGFLRIEIISARLLKALEKLYVVCAILVCLVFLLAWVQLVLNSYTRQVLAPTLTETPLWLPQLVLPVGMGLLLLALLLGLATPPEDSDSTGAG